MADSKTATEQFAQLVEDYGDECDLWGAGSTRACKMFGLIRDKYERAIAATLGSGCTYEQWRAISEAIGDAMEYAHGKAIEYPDKADPLWNLDEYVNRVLEVAFGAATLGSGTCAQCAKDMGAYADSLCDPLKERINKLLRCIENDWHISASWDGLRKFWCIELTEEGVKLRDATHGTLTAEHAKRINEIIEKHWHDLPADYDMPEATALPEYSYDWQAIADELNAELESGTCEVECFDDGVDEGMDGEWFSYSTPTWYLSCGHTAQGAEKPNFCPECGKAVER